MEYNIWCNIINKHIKYITHNVHSIDTVDYKYEDIYQENHNVPPELVAAGALIHSNIEIENINFYGWLYNIEKIVYKKCGMFTCDLVDVDFHKMYNDGMNEHYVSNYIMSRYNDCYGNWR